MGDAQKDFFISYNSADVQWGEWIARELENAGFTTVLQAWDFRPGENFVVGMQRAVTSTKQTIAVLSENYFKADFTQPEWAVAFFRDPRGEERTLLPVRVRPCNPEGFFAITIYIDLLDLEEDAARQELLKGITPGRAKPKGASAFPGKPSSPSTQSKADASAPLVSTSLPKPVFPKGMPPVTKAIEIFTVYSPKDKEYLTTIEMQLTFFKKQGLVTTWDSGQILPGREIDREIEAHWNRSQIILLLISADSLNDSYKMIQRAIARQKAGTARVIPVLLRPCFSEFDNTYMVLPANKKPVSNWNKREDAFFDIARGIRQVAEELLLPD